MRCWRHLSATSKVELPAWSGGKPAKWRLRVMLLALSLAQFTAGRSMDGSSKNYALRATNNATQSAPHSGRVLPQNGHQSNQTSDIDPYTRLIHPHQLSVQPNSKSEAFKYSLNFWQLERTMKQGKDEVRTALFPIAAAFRQFDRWDTSFDCMEPWWSLKLGHFLLPAFGLGCI